MFDYYEALGVLEVSQTTLPATQPNDPVLTNIFVKEHSGGVNDPFVQQWRTEQVPVNDCYLKNMNMYKYIVNIDIDEVIVPTNKTGPTWVEMMQVLENVTENEACARTSPYRAWLLQTTSQTFSRALSLVLSHLTFLSMALSLGPLSFKIYLTT